MPKLIELVVLGRLLSVTVEGESGRIVSGLDREACPSCGVAGCNNECDGSQGADEHNEESEDDVRGRLSYNVFCDALESIVLAHACAGVDVETKQYVAGLETALDAASNQY